MRDNSLKKKLDSFQRQIIPKTAEPRPRLLPSRYPKLAEALGGSLISGRSGSYCLVKTTYSPDYIHGNKCLGEAVEAGRLPLSAFTALEAFGEFDLSSALFLDTETTGLGGSGAVAFLVGCGSVVDGGFEVRQYMLPDYSDENAVLDSLASEFAAKPIIVSYNGAAFDVPLLRDRMIINRADTDLEFEHHVDLLHGVRRLFRRRLNDCRLVNLEQELFQYYRTDDIPGYLIPSIYFEWLSQENCECMPTVLKHNRMDIISLLFLSVHIADVFRSRGDVLDEVDDLHSLSRVYSRRKDHELVTNLYGKIDEKTTVPLAEDLLLFHSMHFKKIDDYEKAVEIWESLSASTSREGFQANIELAKYYEHRKKDPETACAYARKAACLSPHAERQKRQLNRRIDRLINKLKN